MALRVVLYAEGGREVSGEIGVRHAPGEVLDRELDWGPAHHLVVRAIEEARRLPAQAIRFEEPLRTGRGTSAKGTMLYDTSSLRQLLSWADPSKRPDLVIVLVDEDGEASRKNTLQKALSCVRVHHVVAVSVREFEAWLIADTSEIRRVFGSVQSPASPENLERRQAKALLMRWISESGKEEREVRLSLAQACDLGVVRQRCPAFEEFLRDLERSSQGLPRHSLAAPHAPVDGEAQQVRRHEPEAIPLVILQRDPAPVLQEDHRASA